MTKRIKDNYVIVEDTEKAETVAFWGSEITWTLDSVAPKDQAQLYRELAAHMLVEAHHLEAQDEHGISDRDASSGDILRQVMKMLEESREFGEEFKGRIFFGL